MALSHMMEMSHFARSQCICILMQDGLGNEDLGLHGTNKLKKLFVNVISYYAYTRVVQFAQTLEDQNELPTRVACP